ncbi:hypothetical protein HAX54_010749 [Datura stramonium]|uniref:Uncharacterized protein n=1 Tax=Datura stramonium TaxID=4076 RepID=A0ABS8TGU6_DATST|nr:hypothetical protein [Datura stramonium]
MPGARHCLPSAMPGARRPSILAMAGAKRQRPSAIRHMTCKGVGSVYEEPLDDDIATEDEIARVGSDIESSDDDEEDSEIREATLAPTDDEE